ncbi:HAD family hydrolase [Natranaerobius trueperi]|nr:HAD family hydrolase [Natranaerobius trueperi]
MCRGIIFDLDGTLYDFFTPSKIALEETWKRAYNDSLVDTYNNEWLFEKQNGEYLWKLIFWDKLYTIKDQKGYQDISKNFLTHVIKEAWPLFSANNCQVLADTWWYSFFDNIKLEPWVIPLLERLLEREISTGLLSNSPRGIGEIKLQVLGLDKYFNSSNIIWAHDVKAPKPSKTPFYILAKNLGIHVNKTLVIGDNYNTDILGAKNADMYYHLYEQGKEDQMIKKIEKHIDKRFT